MSDHKNFGSEDIDSRLQTVADLIHDLAKSAQGNCLELLALLRMLEGLHQEIRDGLFQDSLPNNRQALYHLLRDIEATGGWPYIYRMKLQMLLKNFQPDTALGDIPFQKPPSSVPNEDIED